MVDKNLIQRLHDSHDIDKRHVLWWQLGFEGRRVLTEAEFAEGLQTERLEVYIDPRTYRFIEPTEMDFQVWKRDDVPILIRDVDLDGTIVPCFISVKPESHENVSPFSDGKYTIPQVNLHPHIRGMVIEQTDRFLFYYPFISSQESNVYDSPSAYFEDAGMWGLLSHPVHVGKVYKELITSQWKNGKRPQRKAKVFNCDKEGFQIVPYFEFDTTQNHVMAYPMNILQNKLDLPVFVKSSPKPPGVEVIGVGYPYFSRFGDHGVCYWELDKSKTKIIKETLEAVLG